MSTQITARNPKLDEHDNVEKTLFYQLDILGWDKNALMQDLLTGKKRGTPQPNDAEVANL